LKCQKKYESLRVGLRRFFSPDQGQDPLAQFRSVGRLLEEREVEKAAEDALLTELDDEEEGKEEHKQEMMETEAEKVEKKVEDALGYLLDVAIERFGYAARDVFKAVFNFNSTTEHARDAFNTTFKDLNDAALSLSTNNTVSPKYSNWIFAISPLYSASDHFQTVKWNVAFKSDWVAMEIMKKLNAKENIEVRQMIGLFQGISPAGSMVGWLFESLAHTVIPEGGFWPLIYMVNQTTLSQPKFVVPQEASPDDEEVKLDQGKRKTSNFINVSDLSALDDKMYYVPDGTNFPLLDSFMVDIDTVKRSATLWIFQVIKSQRHRGSAKSYLHIRKLISILKSQLKEEQPPSKTAKTTLGQSASKSVVNVRYILVVPTRKGGHETPEWQFPAGWNEGWRYNDHRGKVYCLEIPLGVPPVRFIFMKYIEF
jgi:hypothetical protein